MEYLRMIFMFNIKYQVKITKKKTINLKKIDNVYTANDRNTAIIDI